ncbi:MAG: GspE/PulE family protein [Myxococcota bacterium]
MARRVGEILIDSGLIDAKQLEIALAEQTKTGAKLGVVLADLGFTTEEAVSRALAEQSGVEHSDLEHAELEPRAARMVPEDMARRLNALPLRIENEALVVAMSNPTDIVAIDELQRRTDLFVRVVSAGHRQLQRALDRAYRGDASGASSLERMVDQVPETAAEAGADPSRVGVASLVDEIIGTAVRRDATDIHLQPDRNVLRVRLRVDGDLAQGLTVKRSLVAPLVARIKILAGLDISETRVPQDGKIRFPYDKGVVDLRVSTFPTVCGESVVIRVLDKDKQVFSLQSLGLDARDHDILERAARAPNGLILAVGPTGSGKTTTLYALLKIVDASRRKIITLEDPVEYEMPLVTQCQVNDKAGLDFAKGLRAILRHDPDVVLVGEMRDQVTASLAIRAALTGHLVVSSLHTNDSVRSISRLRDMGLDAYLIASCLRAVSAQRLVRRICPDCREPYEPSEEDLLALGFDPGTRGSFAVGKGCDRCNGSGCRGREAIFEVLEVTPGVAQLIARNAAMDEIEHEARREAGLVTFREMAQRRAAEGRISLAEMARTTAEF